MTICIMTKSQRSNQLVFMLILTVDFIYEFKEPRGDTIIQRYFQQQLMFMM